MRKFLRDTVTCESISAAVGIKSVIDRISLVWKCKYTFWNDNIYKVINVFFNASVMMLLSKTTMTLIVSDNRDDDDNDDDDYDADFITSNHVSWCHLVSLIHRNLESQSVST